MTDGRNSLIGVIIFILAIALCGYLMVGFAGVLFSAAFVGGLAIWLSTTYRTPINPQCIILPYLGTIIVFILHV